MDIGIVQITSKVKSEERFRMFIDEILPINSSLVDGKLTVVSPRNDTLRNKVVDELKSDFALYTAWEVDMSHKWRLGLSRRPEEWVVMLADDIKLTQEWLDNMKTFLQNSPPGQYGFRLVDSENKRHEYGEDWMQAPSRKTGVRHRPLNYDIETGWIEESNTAYVANCVVHRDVFSEIQPFGLFGCGPDVMWSMAIRKCGFPIGFNPKAFAYHLGDRRDNR